MLTHNSFFIIILVTVLVIRIFLHGAAVLQSKSQRNIVPKPTLKGFRIHHYVYGLLLIVAALFFKQVAILAMGLGFVIDEVWLVIGLQSNDAEYLSYSSLLGALVLLVVFYLMRTQIFGIVNTIL